MIKAWMLRLWLVAGAAGLVVGLGSATAQAAQYNPKVPAATVRTAVNPCPSYAAQRDHEYELAVDAGRRGDAAGLSYHYNRYRMYYDLYREYCIA